MPLSAYKLLKGATHSQLSQLVQLELSLGNRVLVYQTWSRGGYLCQGVGTGTLSSGTISSYFIITHTNDESFAALLNTNLPYYQPVGAPVIHNSALYQVMGVVTPSSTGGTPGRTPQIRAAQGYIQWKYEDESTWTNIVSLSSISGPSVQLMVDEGYIKWKQSNSEYWENLVALSAITGPSNVLSVGTVTTGAAGSNASASITGTSPSQTLNLTIPRGNIGETGPANSLSVGSVSTVSPSTPASVTITGTAPSQTINFNIPQGVNGEANSLTVGTVTTLSPGASATASITGTAPSQTINLGIPVGATGSTGPANTLTIGTVTTGTAAATITGTAPSQTLNLTLPNFNPQSPVSRTVTIGTAYQHTDTGKAYRVTANVRATQTITLAGTAADKLELRVGPTAAAVAASGSGGFSIAVWESGITGIAVMIGAGIHDGGQMFADLPAGWYFQLNRLSGTNATVVSCFSQTMGV